eukprot:5809747-Amphidinium_carterae.1
MKLNAVLQRCLWWLVLLSPTFALDVSIHESEHRSSPEVALQLGMHTRSRSLSGVRLHHRRERVHIWSKPCRKLPVASRAACERQVDADVIKNDTTWVPLNQHAVPASLTLALDHD